MHSDRSKEGCILTALARLALGSLGACIGMIINTNTAAGLPRLTEKMKYLLQRREVADVVYSTCFQAGVGR